MDAVQIIASIGLAWLGASLTTWWAFNMGYKHAWRVFRGQREAAARFLMAERDKISAEAELRGKDQGYKLALRDVATNMEAPQPYRASAVQLGKLCGECGRMCIHCAKASH